MSNGVSAGFPDEDDLVQIHGSDFSKLDTRLINVTPDQDFLLNPLMISTYTGKTRKKFDFQGSVLNPSSFQANNEEFKGKSSLKPTTIVKRIKQRNESTTIRPVNLFSSTAASFPGPDQYSVFSFPSKTKGP